MINFMVALPKIDEVIFSSGCTEVRKSFHFILTLLEFS